MHTFNHHRLLVSVLFIAFCSAGVGACGEDGGLGTDDGGATGAAAACTMKASARGETGVCPACMCSDASTCRDELEACYDATDVAAAGDRKGDSKSDICADLVQCGRDESCTGVLCIGPCRAEIDAAAEAEGTPAERLSTIIARMGSGAYALGRANALGSCADTSCNAECVAP
jgi:hypothetical protein